MIRRLVVALGLVAGGLVAAGALTVPAAPAHADSFSSFSFGYSSGYYPRHHHRHHGYGYGYGARYVYVPPPPVYYYPPPPPRMVYYPPPPPVYVAPPPPVAYQNLPGGRLADNSQCREYQSTAVVNGRQVPSYGTACLQPDGSWRIVR